MNKIVFAVITISDTCAEDASKDKSGPRLVSLIKNSFQNAEITTNILPDEYELIQKELKYLAHKRKPSVSFIITTGGTGFGVRDVTPEATRPILDKECNFLTIAIAMNSLQKTKFAALSRGLCGIAQDTLILNFPGSEKAVVECFEAVQDILPHALHLIRNDLTLVKSLHAEIQNTNSSHASAMDAPIHICPHKTGTGDANDRNSPYAMTPVTRALDVIYEAVQPKPEINIKKILDDFKAPVNVPPFRASIKDGYAMKSTGFSGTKKVLGCIAAGDKVNMHKLQEDECFKINTGAAIPHYADCVIQVEDTKLLKFKQQDDEIIEQFVSIIVEPKKDLDIRPIGCDLSKGSNVFPIIDHTPVVIESILASVGVFKQIKKPKVAVVSTGSELLAPGQPEVPGKIYDSNSTMLEELLKYFGFDCMRKEIVSDDYQSVRKVIADLFKSVDFVICSGGVSMGDKDYIKPVLKELKFNIDFGRVNMKPGKPMTFASRSEKYFFGLPGNPVSAFVTFHLFVLPALRWASGWARDKCELSTLSVTLENKSIALDPRPEYMRAQITSKNGQLYASINGNQMSSRLQSIVGADVLVHFPARTEGKTHAVAGDVLRASVLRYDFISKYE
ncbi:molybdenum cofactor synthesis protein cinnamon [Teleopsis dalmanni]|uniref:molybdenum cofactor synthesis protein cinnamon n=1 Tax=Teleopsis dalmanni TaxID=139649 RepID=UPI0018CC847F|nr:molybdenum cofactor synthesis protein cinnamon [Teleopsis dalmanni]XP_037935580.1 molybdenum cofactor synthesis protein cinnamon [Teleopsis dalmanni]